MVHSFYDIEPIRNYLRSKRNSKLSFEYLDKGVCILGIRFEEYSMPADDAVLQILQMKKTFIEEISTLGVDISTVEISRMEEESVLVHNPQPYVILD
jgi:hypothetical protein